ncbi:MAG: hypothetical protein ACJ72Z_04470 [Pyrinomonadaceae bacterium]
MKVIKVLFATLLITLGSHTAMSQCCCSGSEVTLTDGWHDTLQVNDLKLTELNREKNGGRIQFWESKTGEAKFQFHVGCGRGTETLMIESGGSTMRIRFKLYGDFGHPKTEIVFSHGDYVAEFEKESEVDLRRSVVIRPATAEEMKEVEPVDKEI